MRMETVLQNSSPAICLRCASYSCGSSKWITAETVSAEVEADEVTYGGLFAPDENGVLRCTRCHCDEIETVDHEYIPSGFASVARFYEIAGDLLAMDNDELERITALAQNMNPAGSEYLTLAELIEYDQDNYQGQHNTDKDFAEEFADQVGDTQSVPEHMRSYIDYEAYARDLMHDYYEIDGHYWRAV